MSSKCGHRDTDPQREMPCEDGGRGGSDASVSQGLLRIASNHQKLEGARKGSSMELSERAWLCRHLDFKLLASKTVREYMFVASSC